MIFEFLRKLVCPFKEIEKFVPKKGKILDVGCGHGIFSRQLASYPKREVLGIDPSKEKIKQAAKIKGFRNLSFKKTYLDDLDGKFQGIVVIDVLYLLSPSEKIKMFNKISRLLEIGGKLVVKLEVTEPDRLFNLLIIEEAIMVKLLKFTFSKHRKFYYQKPDYYKTIIEEAGFRILKKQTVRSFIPLKHCILLAEKLINTKL